MGVGEAVRVRDPGGDARFGIREKVGDAAASQIHVLRGPGAHAAELAELGDGRLGAERAQGVGIEQAIERGGGDALEALPLLGGDARKTRERDDRRRRGNDERWPPTVTASPWASASLRLTAAAWRMLTRWARMPHRAASYGDAKHTGRNPG